MDLKIETNSRVFRILGYLKSENHRGKFALVMQDCENDYHKDQLPVIPAGTTILMEHGRDYGLYAVADVGVVMHNVKFNPPDLHRIHFPEIDGEEWVQAGEQRGDEK